MTLSRLKGALAVRRNYCTMILPDYTVAIMLGGAAIAIGLAYGLYGLGRRMRDPRLDRDFSDDEPAPYDTPASLSPRMDQYMRMLDEDRPPKF